jgi:hypothetical protein
MMGVPGKFEGKAMAPVRRFVPGVPDLVFGLVLLIGLIGGRTRLLNDPGSFWHVRLGQQIARTGAVPQRDSLTYTRARVPWVDQSWGFDLTLATVVGRWGWSGAIGATAVGLAWLYGTVARQLLRDGATPLAAMVVAVLAASISGGHFLVRPHLVTMAFVGWMLSVCRRYHEGRSGAIWLVPPGMMLWANLHGGFLAGPLIVATGGLGHAVSGRWDRPRRRRLLGFAAVFVLACLAPLVNPYGPGLYRHVAHLMVFSGVTPLIAEWQPPAFGTAEALVLELVILALVGLPHGSRQLAARYDLVQILVWLHLALAAVRNVPLFALAVAPGLARLLDGVLTPSAEDAEPLGRRWTFWPAAITLVLALALGAGVRFGGPDPSRWPLAALPILDRQPVQARIFHEQDWGGLIELMSRPPRPAFIDDRFELFGRDSILAYAEALGGGPAWDMLRDRYGIELVWVRPDRALARRLGPDPRWEVLHRDAVSVLFRLRRGAKPGGGPRREGPG